MIRPQGLVNLEALSPSRPRGAMEPGPAAAPNPRLVRAAHEFEAQMMKELLEPMRGEDALTADDEDAGLGQGSGSGGALGEFASEALGQALSERGGFGIADKIVRELTDASRRPGSGTGAGKVTGPVSGK